ETQIKRFSIEDEFLLHHGHIYIPDFEPIKTEILRQAHDGLIAGHFGQAKTYEVVSRDYYWPQMRSFVNDYVRSCDACQRAKLPLSRIPVLPCVATWVM